MAANVVKLRPETYERVKQLAKEHETSMQDVVTRGIDALERAEFARAFQEDFAALRRDREVWQQELAERKIWESTLGDGLSE